MLAMFEELGIGVAFVVVAAVLLFIGLPRHGESPRFLRFEASLVLYPPLIMTCLACGVGLMLRAYNG